MSFDDSSKPSTGSSLAPKAIPEDEPNVRTPQIGSPQSVIEAEPYESARIDDSIESILDLLARAHRGEFGAHTAGDSARTTADSGGDVDTIEECSVADDADDSLEDDGPIECTLPLLDDDYRDIVIDFIQRFDVRLETMYETCEAKGFETLAQEGHWLKGAGGTVGYGALTQPAIDLMNAAREGNQQRCRASLEKISRIRERLIVPDPEGESDDS